MLAIGGIHGSAAHAQGADLQEINRLISANQFDQALNRLDTALSGNPRDAQLRFARGVVLSAMNRNNDAITQFTRLTEDFPDLPEPYNNLAVLYAAQGQYEKARVALEQAIRTQPSYATAHDNLGDIYAKMASLSYEKALQLDTRNEATRTKLTMISRITSAAVDNRQAPKPVASRPAPASPAMPPIASAPPAPAQPAPAAPPAQVPEQSVSRPAAPVRPVEPAASGTEADVLRAVSDWANAWSKQDMASYLGAYGNSFQPPRGQSRKEWEQERRARIEGKDRISVTVEDPVVQVKGDTATVRFRQVYRSDKLDTISRKTLQLSRAGGKWVISAERSGG